MTQKQVLVNIVLGIESAFFKKVFIVKWLNDINQTENGRLFFQRFMDAEEQKMFHDMQELMYMLYPSFYEQSFLDKYYRSNNINMYEAGLLKGQLHGNGSFSYKDTTYNRDDFREMVRIERSFPALGYIFKWEIVKDDWDSAGVGEKFIDELSTLSDNRVMVYNTGA